MYPWMHTCAVFVHVWMHEYIYVRIFTLHLRMYECIYLFMLHSWMHEFLYSAFYMLSLMFVPSLFCRLEVLSPGMTTPDAGSDLTSRFCLNGWSESLGEWSISVCVILYWSMLGNQLTQISGNSAKLHCSVSGDEWAVQAGVRIGGRTGRAGRVRTTLIATRMGLRNTI